MARISGVDLPKKKRIEIGLTYIYGIGRSTSRRILDQLKIDVSTATDDLTEAQVNDIRKAIDSEYTVEGELRTEVSMNIKRLMDLGSYRGLRHRRSLPVRGTADEHQCTYAQRAQTCSCQKEGGGQGKEIVDNCEFY